VDDWAEAPVAQTDKHSSASKGRSLRGCVGCDLIVIAVSGVWPLPLLIF